MCFCFSPAGIANPSNALLSDDGGVGDPEISPYFGDSTNLDAVKVLVGCQSLVAVEGKVRGDPMEKAAFKSLGWTIAKDVAKPRKNNLSPLEYAGSAPTAH